MFEAYYGLLPPHWTYDEDSQVYFNEITQEESPDHPFTIFMRARKDVLNLDGNDKISVEIERLQYELDSAPIELENQEREENQENSEEIRCGDAPDDLAQTMPELEDKKIVEQLPTGKFYEFHCQWTERDLFGKVNLYGLTLRFYEEQLKTVIRFDGLVGEWVYSSIQGMYGPLEHMDFFIGAKITVFGRHLTISSASDASIRWIERERKRLEKQQEAFREKIMAVGKVPCVKGKHVDIVRHITRGAETNPGHTDLRKILAINSRLGAQLASLGLSDQL